MYLLYTFLLAAGLVVTAPYYLLRFRRYLPALRDRFGPPAIPQLHRSIWVHAVSVGEVKAVQKLLDRLRDAHAGSPLVISTITPTGQQLARSAGVADHVFYFPFDLPGPVRRTLDRLDPELVIIAETEIWPNFLRECAKRGIRVVMVNGRISDRSWPRYRMIRGWMKQILRDYTIIGMQSESDRRRIEDIGANSEKVTVFGNLKFDAALAKRALEPSLSRVLRSRQPLWIAASTMPGEEELILDGFRELLKRHPQLTLLIAPRHPERFDGVERLVTSSGLSCVRRTTISMQTGGAVYDRALFQEAEEMSQLQGQARGHRPRLQSEVILLDTIGELAATFEYATVVFMGGTLAPRGGHNILEPAMFAKPIVFGPHMENFREIAAAFLKEHAAVQVRNAGELVTALDQLLSDEHAASELGAKARRLIDINAGATEKVIAALQPVDVGGASR